MCAQRNALDLQLGALISCMDDMVVLLYPIQVVVAEESGQTDQARALTSLIIVSPMWCLFARKFIEVASRDNRNVLTTDSSAQLPLNGNISSLASKGAIATGGMKLQLQNKGALFRAMPTEHSSAMRDDSANYETFCKTDCLRSRCRWDFYSLLGTCLTNTTGH